MRKAYLLLGFLLFLFLFFYNHAHAASIDYNLSNTINTTYSYINTVNYSAYLFFYPNLTQAYSYYYKAVNVSTKNSTQTYTLLQQARSSAGNELIKINKYKQQSTEALAVVSVFLIVILYMLMRPYKSTKR